MALGVDNIAQVENRRQSLNLLLSIELTYFQGRYIDIYVHIMQFKIEADKNMLNPRSYTKLTRSIYLVIVQSLRRLRL